MNNAHDLSRMMPQTVLRHRTLPDLASGEIYYFPRGLPGFEQSNCYSFLCRPNLEPFLLMQALPPNDITFACVDPFLVYPDYEPSLSAADRQMLQLHHDASGVFLAIATVWENSAAITINLRSPVVINRRRRIGHQVACEGQSYSAIFPIRDAIDNLRHRRHVSECGSVQAHPMAKAG